MSEPNKKPIVFHPPFRARRGRTGIWIEDATGLTVADFNSIVVAESPDAVLLTARRMAGLMNVLDQAIQEGGGSKTVEFHMECSPRAAALNSYRRPDDQSE